MRCAGQSQGQSRATRDPEQRASPIDERFDIEAYHRLARPRKLRRRDARPRRFRI